MERFKKIDLATYITKMRLSFWAHIRLEFQRYACLSWSSRKMSNLPKIYLWYRASEVTDKCCMVIVGSVKLAHCPMGQENGPEKSINCGRWEQIQGWNYFIVIVTMVKGFRPSHAWLITVVKTTRITDIRQILCINLDFTSRFFISKSILLLHMHNIHILHSFL